MLALYMTNRGSPSVVTEWSFFVNARSGAVLQLGTTLAQPQPDPVAGAPRLRSIYELTNTPIEAGHAASIYVHVVVEGAAFDDLDVSSFRVTFRDVEGTEYSAQPTTGAIGAHRG